jgi:catalase
MPVESNQFS